MGRKTHVFMVHFLQFSLKGTFRFEIHHQKSFLTSKLAAKTTRRILVAVMAVLFTRCFVAWQLCLSTKPIEIQSTSGNLNELPITRTRTLFYFPRRFELSGVECMTKAHESEITFRLASLIGFTFKVSK